MSNMPNQGQPYQPPQPSGKGSSVMKIVLIILGVLGLGCLCCVGGIYYTYSYGMSEISKQAYEQMKDVPAIKQEFGEISESGVQASMGGTIESAQTHVQAHPELNGTLTIDVEGSKASGRVMVRQTGQAVEIIAIERPDGTLVMMDDLEAQQDASGTE